MSHEEFVLKRNGEKQPVSFDKILYRIKALSQNDLIINLTSLTTKIITRLYNGIKTTEIDELTAQQCASLSTTHPDYGVLSSRILVSNHQKIQMKILKMLLNVYIILKISTMTIIH